MESAISSVISTLGNLAITETKYHLGVPRQVESIKSELISMRGFLKDAESRQRRGDNSATILVQEIRDVAYEVENVVGKISWMQRRSRQKKGFRGAMSRYANRFSADLVTLHTVGKKIENIQNQIDKIFERKDRYDPTKLEETSVDKDEIGHSMDDDLNMQRMVSPYIECEKDVIGFENEMLNITKELTDPLNKDLTFVSLVGMGGIGKSTLARKVFTDPKIQESFDAFAWIIVSKLYKPIELLKDIMKKVMNITKDKLRTESKTENDERNGNVITEEELENMQEQEVIKKLNEFLKNKKYLIVIDDVWAEKALDEIRYNNTVFPDSRNGSRIILTTCNLQVAKHTNCIYNIHKLQLLDSEKSWEFLRKKAFRFPNKINEKTLIELEKIGKELAKKCNGLPLALSVLGGFLSKNIDVSIWSEMINNLDWEETNNSEKNIIEILALSFYDLPYLLKPCFLYMACFPEDHLISTSDLTKMWIAEGFIPFHSKRSYEETARKYLIELAHRSMIQVIKMSKTHGWIKIIQIHDILREYCITESKKIGFLKTCNNHGDFESSSDGMTTYRAAINKSFKDDIGRSMPNLRTLIGLDVVAKQSFCDLNYLRVLKLEGITVIRTLPDDIGRMIFLQYISLRSCGSVKIPSSIGKLINLQTFDARDTEIKSFHGSMWKIPTLRHVYMKLTCDLTSSLPNGELWNIQTLDILLSRRVSTSLRKWKETLVFLRALKKMSGISSLSLFFISSPLKILNVLSNHQNLRVLELSRRYPYTRPTRSLPERTFFPPNLRKLALSRIHLSEDPMPILELLPSLVVLLLGWRTYMGERMSCSAGGFPVVQYISIEGLFNLLEWKIEAGAMPKLSKLNMGNCPQLNMQPEELVHLAALEELELVDDMHSFSEETCNKLEEIGRKVTIKIRR